MAGKPRGWWTAWFGLTPEERWLVFGVLALALVGLTARYLHLRGQKPEPVPPPAVHAPADERFPE